MRGPTVIPPGGGEVIGDAPDRRVELLSDADPLHATGSRSVPFAHLEQSKDLPKELPKNKALPIVVVCPTGSRA